MYSSGYLNTNNAEIAWVAANTVDLQPEQVGLRGAWALKQSEEGFAF